MPRSRKRSRKRSGSRYRSGHGPLASDATRIVAVPIAQQFAESNAAENTLLKLEYAGYDEARGPCLIVRFMFGFMQKDRSEVLMSFATEVGDPVLHTESSGSNKTGTIHIVTTAFDVSTLGRVGDFLQKAANELEMERLRFENWFGVVLPVYGTLCPVHKWLLERDALNKLQSLTTAHSREFRSDRR